MRPWTCLKKGVGFSDRQEQNFKDKIAKVWIEFFIAGQGKDSSFTWKVQG
jgi:hypothetical protein